MYRCRICGGEWTEIPPDAIEIASKRRGVLYQFGGTVHDLRQHKPMSIEEHKHKHRKTPRSNCKFCNPLTWAAEQTKLLQEVQPPVPMVEEVKATIEPELEQEKSQLSAITSLSMAFNQAALRRSKKDSR